MNIKLSIAALVLGGCLLPVAAYSADTTKSAVPPSTSETSGPAIKDNNRADPAHRSAHPVDDSWITTNRTIKDFGGRRWRGAVCRCIELDSESGSPVLGCCQRLRVKPKYRSLDSLRSLGMTSFRSG